MLCDYLSAKLGRQRVFTVHRLDRDVGRARLRQVEPVKRALQAQFEARTIGACT
jgi:hypothetical protein